MNSIVSNFLLDCLINSEDGNFDSFCLNTLKAFVADERSVTLLKQAMLDEQWRLLLEGKANPVVLDFKQKVAFVKVLCSSPYVSEAEAAQMQQRVFALVSKGNVFNDLVNRCAWGRPNSELKEQLWAMISSLTHFEYLNHLRN